MTFNCFYWTTIKKMKTEKRFNKSLHNLDSFLKEIKFSAEAGLWEKLILTMKLSCKIE